MTLLHLTKPFYYCTPDDVYNKLANATCFTVIDFKKGYWQVLLDNESSYMTTFNMPFGCYWFTRLPFGSTVSGDAFQRKFDAICRYLPHTIGIADDMIVWWKKPDFSDHDEVLDRFMQVTRQNNLDLGIDKIQYCKDQVKFFGTTYTTKGHKPTNDKIKAITEMCQPTNVRELQCFLGMCNFLSKYSPRMAELSEDLHQPTNL